MTTTKGIIMNAPSASAGKENQNRDPRPSSCTESDPEWRPFRQTQCWSRDSRSCALRKNSSYSLRYFVLDKTYIHKCSVVRASVGRYSVSVDSLHSTLLKRTLPSRISIWFLPELGFLHSPRAGDVNHQPISVSRFAELPIIDGTISKLTLPLARYSRVTPLV